MPKMVDHTGKRYGRLLVIGHSHKNNHKEHVWECLCDCGNITSVRRGGLTSGDTRSCGCLKSEVTKKRMTKHGMRKTKIYHVWLAMKGRTTNANKSDYQRYGGRGISVCKEWFNHFIVFNTWAIGNGYKEGLEIDRINNDGNYCPDNCRWVTHVENSRNRHDVKLSMGKAKKIRVSISNGESVAQIARKYNVGWSAIDRVKRGETWADDDVLFFDNLSETEQAEYRTMRKERDE